METPDKVYGPLFHDVQMSGIFTDSKTFVDCIPRQDPAAIVERYEREKSNSDFDLKLFVETHFDIPAVGDSAFQGDSTRPVAEHIELLWDVLKREPDPEVPGSSKIPLPHPYIVPGGRFNEIYYWDSYFTMLGLAASGREEFVRSMIDNFATLIDTFGFIPNGNRSYFLSRSQPPFFALMVQLLARLTEEPQIYLYYLPLLEREYKFWMNRKGANAAQRRTVRLERQALLNRYWDDSPAPRQESYREDVLLAEASSRAPQQLYRDLRAACESGWDFSARWLVDQSRLETIATTDIIPVDLNCLLYFMEKIMSQALRHTDNSARAAEYEMHSHSRQEAIQKYCWDADTGIYRDYNFAQSTQTVVPSAAMVFPLFAQIASQEQAAAVASYVESQLLQPGGILTTPIDSGQQWDAPNGWAPLQWVAYEGLMHYGHRELAKKIARAWTNNCLRVYQNTGKLVEKYNVVDTTLTAGGGEYPVQDGFGWTNGVLLRMLKELE